MKGLPSGPCTLPAIVAANALDARETVNVKEARTLPAKRMVPPVGPLSWACRYNPRSPGNAFFATAPGSASPLRAEADYNESRMRGNRLDFVALAADPRFPSLLKSGPSSWPAGPALRCGAKIRAQFR